MKRKLKLVAAGLSLLAILIATSRAQSQPANTTNAPAPTGQFAELARLAMKSEEGGTLPVKLSGLLWPDAAKHAYKIKKISMPGKNEHEERFFFFRADSQDVVLVHRTETKKEDTEYRKEFYYRATINGDLALVLSATFHFEIDDVDNELLKDMSFETYGEKSGESHKPLPITKELRDKFEIEKKYWLGIQKKLAKKHGAREKAE